MKHIFAWVTFKRTILINSRYGYKFILIFLMMLPDSTIVGSFVSKTAMRILNIRFTKCHINTHTYNDKLLMKYKYWLELKWLWDIVTDATFVLKQNNNNGRPLRKFTHILHTSMQPTMNISLRNWLRNLLAVMVMRYYLRKQFAEDKMMFLTTQFVNLYNY